MRLPETATASPEGLLGSMVITLRATKIVAGDCGGAGAGCSRAFVTCSLTLPSAKASGGAQEIATTPITKYALAESRDFLFTIEVAAR
jgi:hypothetical protein